MHHYKVIYAVKRYSKVVVDKGDIPLTSPTLRCASTDPSLPRICDNKSASHGFQTGSDISQTLWKGSEVTLSGSLIVS